METTPKPRAPRSDRGTKRPNPAADLSKVITYCRVSVGQLETLISDGSNPKDSHMASKIEAFREVLKEAGESL